MNSLCFEYSIYESGEAVHEAMSFDVGTNRVSTELGQSFFWENGFGIALDIEQWDFI